MRASPLAVALSLSLIAAPAVAQDFLGRIAQGAAQAAAQRLANRAVDSVTNPRPATPPAARPAAPAPAPARPSAPASAPPAPTATPAQSAQTSAASGSAIVVRNKMPVLSSDGVRVAEILHVPNDEKAYGPDEMFFTADVYYNLRRIYGREASVSGGSVHLRMNAAQFRARLQNPDDTRNP